MAENTRRLIPVERIEETQLAGSMSQWTCYRLIKSGQMPGVVRVGRKVYLTAEGIEEFIARGGAGVLTPAPHDAAPRPVRGGRKRSAR